VSAVNAAALAVAGVIAAGFLVLIFRAGRHITEAEAKVQQILADTRPEPARAVLDTEPGINLADHDTCELLWDMPAFQPSAHRFRDVRDEQQKGETA